MRRLLFTAALLAAASPGWAKWREARSAHFIIYSEDKPEALREYATELERFDAAMRVLRGLKNEADSPHNRLTIFQVSNLAAIRKMARAKSSSGIAGFYDGRAGNSIAFAPRRTGAYNRNDLSGETVLRHEYAHHFMFRNFPGAFPLWFSEGYAEFNATARMVADGSVDLGFPAYHRAGGLLYLGQLPIEKLLTSDLGGVSATGIEALYGRGWLLTHYLYTNKEREGQLSDYLRAINRGTPSLDAARQAFGDLDKLDSDLSRHMRGRLGYYRVPAHRISTGPIEVTELSDGANAIMPIYMQSRRGVTTGEAQKLVAGAREVGAAYPDDPFVQLAVAEAEIDAGNLDEAEAAADRVLKVQPDSIRALMFKGRAVTGRLAAAKSSDAEAWKLARRLFVRANRADPGAPEPLLHFYYSFRAQGVDPTANAVDGLVTAFNLAPEDEGLRLTVGYQMLVGGKPAQARAALAPAAYNPHGGPIAALATRVVEALDKGGAEAALQAWREGPEENNNASK